MEQTTPRRIGEVIEASTTEFVAESYELHDAPPLGALLRASDGSTDIYAVACHARTGSIDPGRRPIARGRDDENEDEVYRRHPELPQLLRTEFRALVVGFRDGDVLRRHLPPRPPRLHGFIYECSPAELVAFSVKFDCLSTLLSATPPIPADELVAAFLRLAGACRAAGARQDYLVAAGKELARALGNNPQRLTVLLARMQG
ncbi:MAG: hypothetical protein M1401_17590 [Chloroflexi bacterium]|nr:hypothetical protein [Chloroflexota bacterium]MCL5110638.1 hypothetical protein [Chloroflexota bacterium]